MKTQYEKGMPYTEDSIIGILNDLLAMRYQVEIVSTFYIRTESKKAEDYNSKYTEYMEIGRINLEILNKAIISTVQILSHKSIKIEIYIEALTEITNVHEEFKNKIKVFNEIEETKFGDWKARILNPS